MKINKITIKLRSTCTRDKILFHVNKVLNKINFKKNYASIQLSFYDEYGESVKIGVPFFLNVTKQTEIRSYKLYLTHVLENKILKEYEVGKIKNLIVEYVEYSKNDYYKIQNNNHTVSQETIS